MSYESTIEWTQTTWNPVTGCIQVSPGCDRCYARTFAERWRGVRGHPYENGFDLELRPERLRLPLGWKRPRTVFVNSMSDLFQKDVPDEFVVRVFEVMAEANWHTFQVLTKRPQRAAKMASRLPWPRNVWLGTSLELTQYRWRADALRAAPAVVRFLSCEPLLGPLEDLSLANIDWVIVGGESGWGARRMDPSWARSLRNQCASQSVAFFFKQAGVVLAKEWETRGKGGEIDGIPPDLRIRQYPDLGAESVKEALSLASA